MKMPAAVFWCYIPYTVSKCGVCLWSESSLAHVSAIQEHTAEDMFQHGEICSKFQCPTDPPSRVSHSSPVTGFKETFKRQPNPGDAL